MLDPDVAVADDLQPPAVEPDPVVPEEFTILDLSLTPLLLSAAPFVAAAVFGHGQRLTAEVEGLV